MANKWIEHLKQFRSQNPGLSLKESMSKAKDSYRSGPSLSKPKPKPKAKSSKMKMDPMIGMEQLSTIGNAGDLMGIPTSKPKGTRKKKVQEMLTI